MHFDDMNTKKCFVRFRLSYRTDFRLISELSQTIKRRWGFLAGWYSWLTLNEHATIADKHGLKGRKSLRTKRERKMFQKKFWREHPHSTSQRIRLKFLVWSRNCVLESIHGSVEEFSVFVSAIISLFSPSSSPILRTNCRFWRRPLLASHHTLNSHRSPAERNGK